MSRLSRPPGFDMTYRPMAEFFGPPWAMRAPALGHGALSVIVISVVFLSQRGLLGDGLYHYLFRERHLIDPYVAAGAFAISAVLSILRDSMRGVQIQPNWIEYRELLSAMWPRVRRYRWAQIEGVTFDESGTVSLELWDGRRELLPVVSEPDGLRRVLLRVARARAIPVIGAVEDDESEEEAA